MSQSAKEIFEVSIPEKLKKNADKITGINCVYEFNVTGDQGAVYTLDLTKEGGAISEGSTGGAQCTVTISTENFNELLEGKLNPQMAFMTGKLKVAGDMGLAIKLGNVIG